MNSNITLTIPDELLNRVLRVIDAAKEEAKNTGAKISRNGMLLWLIGLGLEAAKKLPSGKR